MIGPAECETRCDPVAKMLLTSVAIAPPELDVAVAADESVAVEESVDEAAETMQNQPTASLGCDNKHTPPESVAADVAAVSVEVEEAESVDDAAEVSVVEVEDESTEVEVDDESEEVDVEVESVDVELSEVVVLEPEELLFTIWIVHVLVSRTWAWPLSPVMGSSWIVQSWSMGPAALRGKG